MCDDAVEQIVRSYLQEEKPIGELITELASSVERRFEEAGSLSFEPKNPSIGTSYLTFVTPMRPDRKTEYLELKINDEVVLKLGDLTSIWGVAKSPVAVSPSGPAFVVGFPLLCIPGAKYSGNIQAELDENVESADAKVIRVTVIRQNDVNC